MFGFVTEPAKLKKPSRVRKDCPGAHEPIIVVGDPRIKSGEKSLVVGSFQTDATCKVPNAGSS